MDFETDNFIQQMLRNSFQDCTRLVIAHRLATVMDSDAILVMDAGKGIEFNHPFKLLATSESDSEITLTNGYLSKMVKATGSKTAN